MCTLDRSPGWSRDARSGWSHHLLTKTTLLAPQAKSHQHQSQYSRHCHIRVYTKAPRWSRDGCVGVGLIDPGSRSPLVVEPRRRSPHEASWPPPSLCLDPLLYKLTLASTSLSTVVYIYLNLMLCAIICLAL